MTVLNIVALPKPRMTRRDKWKGRPCVLAYNSYKDALRLEIKKNNLVPTRSIRAIFYLPIPPSYRNKKLYDGKIHDKKPDLDNIIKGIQDTLYQNDSSIYHLELDKYYSLNPRIEIEFL